MATYYIDFVGGADTNNGTSTATPFKHCPGDSNATNTAAATTPAAGDTVIFKGGVVYTGQIGLKSSGTSGSRIVYDGNSAGTWGTGKAIIDGGGSISNLWWDAWNARSYNTIKNFIVRNTIPADTGSHGMYFYPGAAEYGMVIQDCEIYNVGGNAIGTIGNVQLHVTGCILHEGECDGIQGSLGDGSIIEDCEIYNFDSVVNHGDGFQVHGFNTGNATITIRNNRIWGNTQQIFLDAWDGTEHGNFNIYGNVIWKSTGHYNGIIIYTEVAGAYFGTINVYNNTVVDCDDGSGGVRLINAGGGVVNLNVKNNLFHNSLEEITVAKVTGTYSRDYNLWSDADDAAEEIHGQYWLGGTGLFVDYVDLNFHLSANTDAGIDLGSPYDIDPDGITRTTWSRGAYEYIIPASSYVRIY